MDERLYGIVDYILNHAQDRDVEVILKAVKRRYDDLNQAGAMGLKPEQMARETASRINEQMGFSRDMIRDTVKNLARETIRKNAPELTDEQMDELLDAWVPDPGSAKPSGRNPGETPRQAAGKAAGQTAGKAKTSGSSKKKTPAQKTIPRDALITMVRQFASYSQGTMPASEQLRLEGEVPGWTKKYWEGFPPELRQLLALYLKGVLNEDDFKEGFSQLLKET